MLDEAKVKIERDNSASLDEWRTANWESLMEVDRIAIRRKTEQSILEEIMHSKDKVREVIAYDLRYNHPNDYAHLLEQAKQDAIMAAQAEFTAEAKSEASTTALVDHDKLRQKATEDLKDQIDQEVKTWGVSYRAHKLETLEAAMSAAVTNDDRQTVYMAAHKMGIGLQGENETA